MKVHVRDAGQLAIFLWLVPWLNCKSKLKIGDCERMSMREQMNASSSCNTPKFFACAELNTAHYMFAREISIVMNRFEKSLLQKIDALTKKSLVLQRQISRNRRRRLCLENAVLWIKLLTVAGSLLLVLWSISTSIFHIR